MLTIKPSCLYCGTVNQPTVQNCIVCGGSLTVDQAFEDGSDRTHDYDNAHAPNKPEWQPRPDQVRGIPPFDFGDVLSTTLKLFFRHLWLITKIVFVIVTPFEILKASTLANAPSAPQASTITFLLAALCNVLIAPALVYALMKNLQTGTTPTVHESFRWGLTKLVRFSICAAASYFITGVGYLLCIIPGIILALKYAVVYPVAILENHSIGGTFRRSDNLTKGSRGEIFGIWIVVGLLLLVVIFPINMLQQSAHSALLNIVGNIVIDIAEQLLTVLSLVIYLSELKTTNQFHSLLSPKN